MNWEGVSSRHEGIYLVIGEGSQTGKDGAQWIVEARRDRRYHVVDRWSDTDHDLESVGRLFLDLAGLRSDVRYWARIALTPSASGGAGSY